MWPSHSPRRTRNGLPATLPTAQDNPESAYPKATRGDFRRQSIPVGQDDEDQRIDFDTTSVAHGHPTPVTEPALVDNALEGDAILPDDSSFSYIGKLILSAKNQSLQSVAGDKRGPRQSVYDLCHPGAPQEARPYMPPKASNISHKPHEIEYMRLQGAFENLPPDVCDELIRCYFQHVHFFLPIVDAPGFLNAYISDDSQNISRLLLWSMLLAAANVSFFCTMVIFVGSNHFCEVCRDGRLEKSGLFIEESHENCNV
jgi:hypothetical protein